MCFCSIFTKKFFFCVGNFIPCSCSIFPLYASHTASHAVRSKITIIKLFINNYNLVNIPLDDKIPFIKEFIYIYMIWYPFLIFNYYIIYKSNKEKYIKLVLATITSLIMLYIFFILYPSKVIRPDINSYNDLTTFILYIVYKVDSPTNCFPSGHCLLCFTLIYSLLDNQTISNKLKMPALIINILIIMSTLFVKQHVILDVISAFALATINYYFTVNLKFFNQIKKKMKSHT